MTTDQKDRYVRSLDELGSDDVELVGGKNASLGELVGALRKQGIRVPAGFATTVAAYHRFLAENSLDDRLRDLLAEIDGDDASLARAGKAIRAMFRRAEMPADVAEQIIEAYVALSQQHDEKALAVAVRSSATAEDLPEASFAGQQDTFLNVRGAEDVVDAARDCFASLFTDRAIAYRREHGFDPMDVALSVGVQKMVRADRAGAGVMFTLDTDSGFPGVVVINACFGLGENVVQGTVDPDEYRVFKPLLDRDGLVPLIGKSLGAKQKKMIYSTGSGETTRNVDMPKRDRRRFVLRDDEILQLARWAVAIERHYDRPMDIEWAKDGEDGRLYVVQARPETVQSRKDAGTFISYRLAETGEVLSTGLAIGDAIGTGPVRVVHSPDEGVDFEEGAVLVTERTDPDWVPLMKRAAAIVTDHGGRTSHAAIVSRELAVPAVVGTESATDRLADGRQVTVSCAEGEHGRVYDGELEYEAREIDLSDLPDPPVRIMLNVASPAAAMRWWRIPAKGIGLARMEFIINNVIQIHPLALTRFADVEDEDARRRIEELTRGYARNVFLAREFARRFDGFSIGSNDLTQLVLGVDRDSSVLADLFDERDPAVERAITEVIERAHAEGCKVGICGQAPSDHFDFARFLVERGIDSMSLNPDSALDVVRRLAEPGS